MERMERMEKIEKMLSDARGDERIATKELNRQEFVMNRSLEFFTEKELSMQIGQGKERWGFAVMKELIDNALDACETAGVAPELHVRVLDDEVSVRDNGNGLPYSTLKKSLDYEVRVSDKSFYVSPTRGQLGNALKCVWAVPYVLDGTHGMSLVETPEGLWSIKIEMDEIAGQERVTIQEQEDDGTGNVRNGTKIKLDSPQIEAT